MTLAFASVQIHGIPCFLTGDTDAYRVVRADTGAELASAPRRFLALARAAVLLHTPSDWHEGPSRRREPHPKAKERTC